MSDAPNLAELIMQLRYDMRDLSRRMAALERHAAIQTGTFGGSLQADSEPVVITDHAPNAPR